MQLAQVTNKTEIKGPPTSAGGPSGPATLGEAPRPRRASSAKREPRPKGREKGRGLGNPHGVGGMKGYVTRAPLGQLIRRARGSSRNVVLFIDSTPRAD